MVLGFGDSGVLGFWQVTTQLWRIALKFRFKLPPYYTLVLRSLASLEGGGWDGIGWDGMGPS